MYGRLVKKKTIESRKSYICGFCRSPIPSGSSYYSYTWLSTSACFTRGVIVPLKKVCTACDALNLSDAL